MASLELVNFSAQDLAPLNLKVNSGITCLSGVSGSGKSLFLRAITDLIVHSGNACLDDKMCSDVSPVQWRKWVGFLPAESAWWQDIVGDHFIHTECEYLKYLGLPAECLSWELSRCSTGEKQRLAIARLLEQRPQVLLLDEPTASLDAESVIRVETLIQNYVKENQTPVIWVSHDPQQIKRIANQHYAIKNHEIVQVSV